MTKQGGKKKKQVLSLGQFHSITPSQNTGETNNGGGVSGSNVSQSSAAPQLVRINWADEMEKLDDNSVPTEFIFDRSKLPTAPKSVLKSEIDLELVPKKPPFRAYLGNISFEADEDKIKAFFKDLKVQTVHLATDQGGRSRGSGYVDFEERESLISALNKNETQFINRSIRITLQEPRSFGGNQSGNISNYNRQQHSANEDGTFRSDEASWRRNEPEIEQPTRSYNSYSANQQQTDGQYRYSSNRYNQQSDQQPRYQPRNARHFNNSGSGNGNVGYSERRSGGSGRQDDDPKQQRRQYSNYSQNKQYNQYKLSDIPKDEKEEIKESEIGIDLNSNKQITQQPQSSAISELKERPKLMLNPRTLPVETLVNEPVSNSSIFGGAKPVNTAARERQIEERLKEKERIDALEKKAVNTTPEQTSAIIKSESEEQSRSHKTSTTSDDQNKSQNHDAGGKQSKYQQQHQFNKNDNNNNQRNQNRMTQSSSFTSPISSNQQRASHQYQHNHSKTTDSLEPLNRTTENVWNSRPPADLFNKESVPNESSSSELSRSNFNSGVLSDKEKGAGRQYNSDDNRRPKRNDYQNKLSSNKDNKDRGTNSGRNGTNSDRNKLTGGRNQRSENRQFNNRPDRSNFENYTNNNNNPQYGQTETSVTDNFEFNNKFAKLKVDVDEVENDF